MQSGNNKSEGLHDDAEKAEEQEQGSTKTDSAVDSTKGKSKTGYDEEGDHSHTNTSAYEEMLDAKEIQNSPLPIPITSGPQSRATASHVNILDHIPGPTVAGVSHTTSSGPDEVARSAGANLFPSSHREFQSPLPVEAVPITSIYQQVASAELIDAHQQPSTTTHNGSPTSSPKPPSASSLPQQQRPGSHNDTISPGVESEEVKLERLRVQRQRFKICKLVILLCILIVVITVPLVIRNQNQAPPGGGGGSSSSNCFPSYELLESAVDDYLAGGTRREKATSVYGDPIGIWCVSQLPDGSGMDSLFSALRNPKAADFDDPLYYWDVSKIVSMQDMFRNATTFSQPLGGWNVSSVRRMTGMFLGASSFQQDLCAWPSLLSETTLVHNMFLDTNCDNTEDPLLAGSATGSFCTPC